MKNHYYENIRRTFKSAPPIKSEFVNKIFCHHSFIEIAPTDLTWWSDFSFLLNGCYITVYLKHPRMAFQEAVTGQACIQAKLLFGDELPNALTSAVVPIYKKLGKSRKQISAWLTLPSKINSDAFATVLKLAQENVRKETDIIVKPSIVVRWWKDGKSVSLCAPAEIRSAEDVAALLVVVKRILKHEIGIDEAFNQFRYSRVNWFEEYPAEANLDQSL